MKKISRDIFFQVLAVSKVLSRLDVLDDFWAQHGVQRKWFWSIFCNNKYDSRILST